MEDDHGGVTDPRDLEQLVDQITAWLRGAAAFCPPAVDSEVLERSSRRSATAGAL